MKRLMMTAAALALLITTAHADDVGTAKNMMIANLYDRDCEPVAGLERMVKQLLVVIPADAMHAGVDQALAYYRSMSREAFCVTAKPLVASAVAAAR
jgi:hypothetical protein